jgi:hypothetical protein
MCNMRVNETIEHLFFSCPLSIQCWNRIEVHWDLTLNIEDRIYQARQDNNLDFFLEMTLLAAWELWKLRNDKIFNRGNHSIARWFSNFQNQCYKHLVRFKADLRSTFRPWLDAFS